MEVLGEFLVGVPELVEVLQGLISFFDGALPLLLERAESLGELGVFADLDDLLRIFFHDFLVQVIDDFFVVFLESFDFANFHQVGAILEFESEVFFNQLLYSVILSVDLFLQLSDLVELVLDLIRLVFDYV